MTGPDDIAHERLILSGRLEADGFVPWIRRHAAKLGLSPRIGRADARRIEFDVEGPVELIDMMEVACSLGPIDVWVEAVDREPSGGSTEAAATP